MPDDFEDPVVEQLHQVRDAMLADAANDPAKLIEWAGKRQNDSAHPLISVPLTSAPLPSIR